MGNLRDCFLMKLNNFDIISVKYRYSFYKNQESEEL